MVLNILLSMNTYILMQCIIVLVVRIVHTFGTISMKEEIHRARKNNQKDNRKGSVDNNDNFFKSLEYIRYMKMMIFLTDIILKKSTVVSINNVMHTCNLIIIMRETISIFTSLIIFQIT